MILGSIVNDKVVMPRVYLVTSTICWLVRFESNRLTLPKGKYSVILTFILTATFGSCRSDRWRHLSSLVQTRLSRLTDRRNHHHCPCSCSGNPHEEEADDKTRQTAGETDGEMVQDPADTGLSNRDQTKTARRHSATEGHPAVTTGLVTRPVRR